MASIVWSWQAGIVAHGDLQHIPHGGMLPTEQEMPEHIGQMYRDRRLERMSAFRQVQALSNTIKQLGMWNGIDDFQLADDYRVDAVEAGETRVLAPAQDHGPENRNYAVRVRAQEGTCHRVLPDSAFEPWQSYKLLVVNLDQGGVGASGVVFAQESMKLMLYAHWDKFHRVIRDIALALNRSTSGLFLKTRTFSAHLWSLNYKPWDRDVFATAVPTVVLAFVSASARDEGPEGLGGVPASVWYERRRAGLCTFDLVWLSGDVIKQYTEEPDRIIDRVRQDISEGLLGDQRVAHAQTFDTGGNWLGSYINGQWVSACTVPSGATLTVIRRKTKANDPASPRPMCYKCRDFWDVEDDNTALECGHDTLCMKCHAHFCGRSCPFKCRIVDEEAEQQRAPLTDGLSAPSGSAG